MDSVTALSTRNSAHNAPSPGPKGDAPLAVSDEKSS